MNSLRKGLVIAFDGPDGVGKTTQIKLAKDYLEQKGFKVWVTRNSGGTPIGERLRQVSLSDTPRPAETDLFISLAMGAALAEELPEHTSNGEICLIDRSPLALVAYNGFGSLLENINDALVASEKMFRAMNLHALIYYSAPQDVLQARLSARTDKPADYYEKQGADYARRVEKGYAEGLKYVSENIPELKVIELDASGSISEIQQQTSQALDSLL